MSLFRTLAVLFTTIPLLTSPTVDAGPYSKPEKGEKKLERKMEKRLIKVTRKGEAYCFDTPIAHGTVIVAPGRCYTFYVMRTSAQSFLAFGPPGPPMIPPGQLVRMNTPAGAKTKGRLFYLVPLSRPVTIIPVNTIQYVPVPVVVAPQPGQVLIRVPVSAGPTGSSDREVETAFIQH